MKAVPITEIEALMTKWREMPEEEGNYHRIEFLQGRMRCVIELAALAEKAVEMEPQQQIISASQILVFGNGFYSCTRCGRLSAVPCEHWREFLTPIVAQVRDAGKVRCSYEGSVRKN